MEISLTGCGGQHVTWTFHRLRKFPVNYQFFCNFFVTFSELLRLKGNRAAKFSFNNRLRSVYYGFNNVYESYR